MNRMRFAIFSHRTKMVSIRQYCACGLSIYRYLFLRFSPLRFFTFLFVSRLFNVKVYKIRRILYHDLKVVISIVPRQKNNASLLSTSRSSLGPFTHFPLRSISHGDKRWPLVQSQQSMAHKQTINTPSFKFGITCSEKVHLHKKQSR